VISLYWIYERPRDDNQRDRCPAIGLMPGGVSSNDDDVYFAASLEKSFSILRGANTGRSAFFRS
jgi:hypothetical protein